MQLILTFFTYLIILNNILSFSLKKTFRYLTNYIGKMNNLTKFNKCFVSRIRLYRQIIIATSEINRNKRFYSSTFSGKNVARNGFILSCGLCCGIIGYSSFKDYFTSFLPSLPTVSASTKTSPRNQVILFIIYSFNSLLLIFLFIV